jgi:pyrroloquinoline quinone (PQQ) biosynthesis protein C
MLPNYRPSVELLSQSVRNFPWEDKRAYGDFMAQTYYYVCHSIRLLAASAARFSQADQHLHRRFLKHADEENSHELLALRDLQQLGFKLEDFPECAHTRSMYEIQYYKIEHLDPAALMGYILVLETMAGNDFKWLYSELQRHYPENTLKFVKVHAEDDPDHIEKALQVVSQLESQRLEHINISMEQSAQCYHLMLEGIKARTQKVSRKRAA